MTASPNLRLCNNTYGSKTGVSFTRLSSIRSHWKIYHHHRSITWHHVFFSGGRSDLCSGACLFPLPCCQKKQTISDAFSPCRGSRLEYDRWRNPRCRATASSRRRLGVPRQEHRPRRWGPGRDRGGNADEDQV